MAIRFSRKRALTGCDGLFCHEYDHIVPYAKGGQTSVENCQVLQTRVNRYKRDLPALPEQYKHWSATLHHRKSMQNDDDVLDWVEMAVYGDVRRAEPGPLPKLAVAYTVCRCKSAVEMVSGTGKSTSRYDRYKSIDPC